MANLVSVNFEGVESGTNYIRVPEGDYGLKIAKVQQKKGKESGKSYLLFDMKVVKGNQKGVGKTISHSCSLSKNSLWNLRNVLEAAGKTVPSKVIKIDLDKLVGLTLAGSIVDDEYEGKKKSVIAAVYPMSEFSEGGKDEETEGETEEETDGGDEEGEAEETGSEEDGEEEELFE